jgi:hypothetical protein
MGYGLYAAENIASGKLIGGGCLDRHLAESVLIAQSMLESSSME